VKGKFDWRATYFNVVSLVAIIFFLFAAVSAGQGLLRMAFPKLSLASYEWETVESYQAFKLREGGAIAPSKRPGPEVADTLRRAPTEEELHQAWEDHKQLAVEGARRSGLWGLLESFVGLLVAVPVLLYHRRAAKRLRPDAEAIADE
jgi:hypothetical protein